MREKVVTHRKSLVATSLLLLLALALPQLMIVVAIVLFGVAIARLSNSLYVTGFVVSFLTFGLIGALFVHIITMLGLQVNIIAVAMFTSCVLALLSICLHAREKSQMTRPIIQREILHASIYLFIGLFLMLPIFRMIPSQFFSVVGAKEDTSSQFQMFNALIKTDRLPYQNSAKLPIIRDSLRTYPQASHAAMAVTGAPLVKNADIVVKMKWYYAYFAMTYAAVTYLLILLSLFVVKKQREDSWIGHQVLWSGLLVIMVGLGLLFTTFSYGFYGQVFSYASLLLGILAASYLFEGGRRIAKTHVLLFIFLFGLSVFGVFGSWYLLIPVLLPFIVLVGVWSYKHRNNVPWIYLSLLFLPIFVSLGYLLYVYAVLAPSGTGHLLTSGGVLHLPRRLYVITGVPMVLIMFWAYTQRRTMLFALSSSGLVASIFTYLVGRYQFMKLGHLEYYFYKTLFTAVLLSLPTMLMYIRHKSNDDKGSILAATTSIACVVSLIVLLGITVTQTSQQALVYYDTVSAARQTNSPQRIETLLDNRIYDSYGDAIYVGQCDPYLNFMGTIWAGASFVNYHFGRAALEGSVLNEQAELAAKKTIQYASQLKRETSKKLLVVNEGDCTKEWSNLVASSKNVEIKTRPRL